ncbi:MAG: long-chain-fatty-acid--CoA ligase [Proteobacteria bacterium]|nr:long-chain-fatty-acid--CoA ligase [Pseudomonadota bacterium]
MDGLMMRIPLSVPELIRHADRCHGDTEVVSRTIEGPIHRYTYREAHRRARRLARALLRRKVGRGERIGTLAWNGYRHFELYYSVSGIGAVVHTINPRLFADQLAYIVNHADDQLVFFDLSFTTLVEKLAPRCPGVAAWVAMTDAAHRPAATLPNLVCYEDLLAAEDDDYEWPDLDETSACALCYTSGTTGNPRGVLYSHRSTVLHALTTCLPDVLNLGAQSVVLPIVPMFHVNAWGLPYAAPLVGAKLVLPGAALDGKSLYALFEDEGVTHSAGVPTVWLGMIDYLKANGLRFSTFRETIIGGSACPPAMMRTLREDFGVDVKHGWGMTETSPIATAGVLKRKHAKVAEVDRTAIREKQGRPLFGVEMKIVDADGRELPHDGTRPGNVLVRGSWVATGYFRGEGGDVLASGGWFPTGDVGTVDPDQYLQITDRSKDVIKSGGEWISSIELENIAFSHPEVTEAAVIGLPHPKWDERPLLIAVRKAGSTLDRNALLAWFDGRTARWWIPDDVVFVDELPHTATGKLSKRTLRERFRDHRWPASTRTAEEAADARADQPRDMRA